MMDKNFSYASWNTTQSIQNAITSLNNLKPFVPEDYALEDDVDKLERKLYQSYKLAMKIISAIEAAEAKHESN